MLTEGNVCLVTPLVVLGYTLTPAASSCAGRSWAPGSASPAGIARHQATASFGSGRTLGGWTVPKETCSAILAECLSRRWP